MRAPRPVADDVSASTPSGGVPSRHEVGEPLAQHARLAGAGAADHEQRAARVADGRELRFGRGRQAGWASDLGYAAAWEPKRLRGGLAGVLPAAADGARAALERHPSLAERGAPDRARRGRRHDAGDRPRRRGRDLRGARAARRRPLTRDQRGARRGGDRTAAGRRRGDRPDRRLAQREARRCPSTASRSRWPRAPTMADVEFGYVLDLGHRDGRVVGRARRGRVVRRRPAAAARPERGRSRSSAWRPRDPS